MGDTVLVTGASGFVGRAICARLMEAGFKVEGWYRSHPPPAASRKVQVDLTATLPAAPAQPIRAVIHTAAVAHARPTPQLLQRLEAVNVGGTRRMLAWAAAAGVERFIFLSSIKAQGAPAPGVIGRESDPPQPEGVYGEAKLQGEALVADWAASGERCGIALRLPLVYGPGVGGNVEKMARAARRGLLPQIGDGSALRSLISVGNVASAVATVVHSESLEPAMHTYLLTDGRPYSVAELGRALARASGRKVHHPRLPLTVARLLAQAGDLGERILRRPLPFSSEVLARLATDATFSSEPFQRDFGWRPEGQFTDHAKAILAALDPSSPRDDRTNML